MKDAALFPGDELLSQRALWLCLRMVLAWTVLGLAAYLPLYMVDTPCLAESNGAAQFTGAYSVLQDISLLRLLRLLDAGSATTNTDVEVLPLLTREIVDGTDRAPGARTRIIIVTVLAIVLGVIPALWSIIREFNRLVAYRRNWVDARCQGLEMGWLSARKAPGFVGWGEKRLKDFIVKTGLSASLEPNENSNARPRRRRNREWNSEERAQLEIDIQNLFSIGYVYTSVILLLD